MSAYGYLLPENRLPEFKRWLNKQGWVLAPVKHSNEILRATKSKHTIILGLNLQTRQMYCKDSDYAIIKRFLRDN